MEKIVILLFVLPSVGRERERILECVVCLSTELIIHTNDQPEQPGNVYQLSELFLGWVGEREKIRKKEK